MENSTLLSIRLFTLFSLSLLVFTSCSQSNQQKEKQEVNAYTFEIIDSVMVDYIGEVNWSAISKDGKHFLVSDWQKKDILLISSEGKILNSFNKTGDQPDAIGPSALSRPQFTKSNEWAIMGRKGISAFDFEGNQTRKASPDFTSNVSFIQADADNLLFISEDKAIVHLMGRDEKMNYYINPEATQLELIDLKEGDFKGIITFPEESRFNNQDEIHDVMAIMPAMRIHKNKLYLAFKNDPKIYIYSLENLDNPSKTISVNAEKFELKKGLDPSKADLGNIMINPRDFSYGRIEQIFVQDEKIIIEYSSGLSDSEFSDLEAENSDPNVLFSSVFQKNKKKYAVVDSEGNLTPLNFPDKTWRISFVDNEGAFWLAYNQEEELDYELIYKAKLVSK
ncbi:hypothetical protein ACFOUP_13335 [Belliella kenyensis]|uniref:TolB-like 6-blade propeller-like n=1 Tax=Belliella kenyensis TaxID=1472724 RepID=A0ABV8EMW7_9BACT|nr:hypothetical protein [Belliella kenyensis]MCH7403601.1 hypothetical protein [Belliella kenyensis]MDN3603847.1 hypothetical protein [Belliella kenyensis]